MNEGKIDLLEWQKENLGEKEKEEIYGVPEKPETKFKGIDENKDNEEIVPEKSEVEKTEERLLEDNSRKRKGGLTGTEKKIGEDDNNDRKHDVGEKQFKAGRKEIAKEKRKRPEVESEKQENEQEEKKWNELENDMYKRLYKKLEKEYDEADSQDLYFKKLKGDLEKFEIGSIDEEDEEFLKSFGFNKKDKKNGRIILESYEKVVSKILDELKEIKETEKIDSGDDIETDEKIDKESLEEQRQEIMEELEKLDGKGYIDKEKQQELDGKLKKVENAINKDARIEEISETPVEIREEVIKEDVKEKIIEWKENKTYLRTKKWEEPKFLITDFRYSEDNNIILEDKYGHQEFIGYDELYKLNSGEEIIKENLKEGEVKPEIESEPETIKEPEIGIETRESVSKNVGEIVEKMRAYKWSLQKRIAEIPEENKSKLEDYNMGKDQSEEDKKTAEEIIKLENMSKTAALDELGAEIAASSFERDPRKRREAAEAVSEDLGNLLKTLQAEIFVQQKESNRRELGGEKDKIIRNFVNISKERAKKAVSEKDNQQAEESKKKSRFSLNYLKEELGIGSKKEVRKKEEMNEKISNVTKLEDLAEVADFIEKKYGMKFKGSFKESLRDENSEVLRRNYNNDIEVINSSKEESKRDTLIKFYEKLDELLKEKEREDNPVDIIEDLLPIEEIEPIELTPEIEISETEEVSEEIKMVIREGLVKLKGRNKVVFDKTEGFINSFLSSEKSFSDDFSKVQFNSFIKGYMDLEYEDIENIKTNDFFAVLREAYDEVKGERKEEEKKETEEMTEKTKKDIESKIKIGIDDISDNKIKEFQKDLKNNLVDDRNVLYERGLRMFEEIGIDYNDIKEIDANWLIETLRKTCDEKTKTSKDMGDEKKEETKRIIKKVLKDLKKRDSIQFEAVKTIIDRNTKEKLLGRDPSFNNLSGDLKISDVEKRIIGNMKMGEFSKLYDEIKKEK